MSGTAPILLPLVIAWFAVWGPAHPLASEEASGETGSLDSAAVDLPPLLAPSLPFESRELSLLVVEREGFVSGERPLEVVRYGQRGSLRRPVALDLPEEGRAIVLEAWDWLRLTDRALSLVEPDDYAQWLHLDPGTQGVILSERRFELFHGTVRWSGENDGAARSAVTIGDLTVRGRGRAVIRRDESRIELTVERGRFEIERGDALVAVAAAGQERSADLGGAFAVTDPAESFAERRGDLLDALDGALAVLLSDGTVDGETLARLWEAILRLVPLFAAAEADRAAWVTSPEVARSDIGEALRLLRAYDFRPPPAAGM